MRNLKFYACSVGQPGKDYVERNLERILKNKSFILHKDTIQKGVYSSIQPGDILLLKYNSNFIAYGKTIGIITTDNQEWNLRAPVIEWIFKDPDDPRKGIKTYGIGYETIGGGPYGTVKELTMNFGLQKIKEINRSSDLYMDIMKEVKP